ncbi:MAG: hypothetical protein BMS9Abin07_1129 [Acidimicrobiia bacterium]|nr:MAG: hypothetical protein BMS9Abin07_1129 [Acidimicrobiia bacterium]
MDPSLVPERIEVSQGAAVVITWNDATSTTFTAAQLRAACECAECREPAGRRLTEAVLAGPEPVTITETRLVGSYAVNFIFGPDGHSPGIFTFPALHALSEPDPPAR